MIQPRKMPTAAPYRDRAPVASRTRWPTELDSNSSHKRESRRSLLTRIACFGGQSSTSYDRMPWLFAFCGVEGKLTREDPLPTHSQLFRWHVALVRIAGRLGDKETERRAA